MIPKKPADLLAYALVSVLSVSGAFLISLHFVKRAKAQDAGAPPAAAPAAAPAAGTAAAVPNDVPNPNAPPSGDSSQPQPLPGPPPAETGNSQEPVAAPPSQTAGQSGVPTQSAPQPAPSRGVPGQQVQPAQPALKSAAAPGAPAAAPPAAQPGQPATNAVPGTTSPAPSKNSAGSTPISGISELEGFLEPFIYDIVNRRDPFQPYAEYVPSNGTGVDDNGPPKALSPAQRWDLDQLKLIGIMWDIRDPKAMFLDPEEDVMILGRDESIGNKNGYVATIREGEVVVVEAIRKRGDIIYRTRVLRIER